MLGCSAGLPIGMHAPAHVVIGLAATVQHSTALHAAPRRGRLLRRHPGRVVPVLHGYLTILRDCGRCSGRPVAGKTLCTQRTAFIAHPMLPA
jgi:hypothetical protein